MRHSVEMRRLLRASGILALFGVITAADGWLATPDVLAASRTYSATDGASRLPTGPEISLRHAGPLAVSPSGVLYVVDDSRQVVLERLRNGKFAAVAGDGTAGFDGDGGPATEAQLSDVADICFGPGGELYLADGSRVREVGRDGTIQTIAGNGGSTGTVANGTPALSAALGPVSSVAFSPSGQLYLATSSQLLRVSPSDQLETVAATVSAGLNADRGPLNEVGSIAVDTHGDVYASSTFAGWSLFEVSPDGVATYLGYDRRSGGNTAIIERGPGGVIEADDGSNVLRIQGSRLATAFAVSHLRGVKNFVFMDFFAIAPNGTLYADDLGPPAFEAYQQIIAVTNRHAISLWKGPPRKG